MALDRSPTPAIRALPLHLAAQRRRPHCIIKAFLHVLVESQPVERSQDVPSRSDNATYARGAKLVPALTLASGDWL